MARPIHLLLVSGACALLLGCGSGAKTAANTWSQKGSSFHLTWTVPSATSIDIVLAGAMNVTSCRTTSRGRSVGATLIAYAGQPAAFIAIGKVLRPGARARTTCEVSGTVTSVSGGGLTFTQARVR